MDVCPFSVYTVLIIYVHQEFSWIIDWALLKNERAVNIAVLLPCFDPPGLHRQLRPALPPGALLALPDHAHRRGHKHGQANAAVPRAYVQPAALHAVRAQRALEDGQRGGHFPGHSHPHWWKLHPRPVSHAHKTCCCWGFFVSIGQSCDESASYPRCVLPPPQTHTSLIRGDRSWIDGWFRAKS